jgi:hypothetical protein
MPDVPEIPEAKDPFEKQVAVTIAIIAIVLSFVSNKGDNAKADAIIRTNEATNQWGYYQAKSIKGQMAEMHASLLSRLPAAQGATPETAAADADRLRKEATRYDAEKGEIQTKAKELQAEAERMQKINDRCDMSALFLQIGIVISSVAILASSRPFWWIGILLGIIGTVVGVTAFLM